MTMYVVGWWVSHYLSEIAYLHIYRLNDKVPEVCFEIKCMAGIEGEDEIHHECKVWPGS